MVTATIGIIDYSISVRHNIQIIYLYTHNNEIANAYILFTDNPALLNSPKAKGYLSGPRGTHLHGMYSFRTGTSMFHPIIDLLRNEKPVYFEMVHEVDLGDGKFLGKARIYTKKEPVGEEELIDTDE